MAWVNIFELGPVTLYWEDENGDLREIAELAEGTITETDGVVVASGVRSQYTGGGSPNTDAVLAIVAVPVDAARGFAARISVPSISSPRPPGGSGANIAVSVGSVLAGVFTESDDPTPLTANTVGGVITSVTPNTDVEIGFLPASGTVGVRFRSTESLS